MHLTLSAALLTIVAVCLTTALPDGAPTSVCETLTPSHGGIPGRATASPFSLRTEATAVHQGEKLTVYIDAQPPELMFGGFMLHALNADGLTEVIGSFVPIAGDTETKYITCGSIADSTVTHTHSQPKSAGKAFEWLAPANFVGDVVFRGTVAQKYDTFWVGVESDEVRVVAAGEPLPPGSGGAAPRPTSKPTVAPFPEGQKDPSVALDPIYNGCGDTKECLGFPRDCAASRSCDSIGTLSILGDRYIFEIRTWISSAAYVALGLSDDDKMGDDAVIECVPEQGTVRAFTSWTSGPPNYGADRQVVPQRIIRLLESSYVNGSIFCRVERDAVSTIQGTEINLLKKKYRLLLATGSSLKPTGIGYHDLHRIVSGDRNVVLLRLHAAFMLAAWIGTASAGILMARYFKQTWVGSQLCGKDQWFVWHRTFMVLTWSLTMAGFVIIFVELGAWSGEQNPHAILGTVTTVLCFIQPFGAMMRPAPTHRNRPLFNWGHWLVGNLAHILAIVTIFFAVKLTKAELPDWFDWILVAFVAFHVAVHVILSIFLWIQIANCFSDRSDAQRINSFQMSDVAPVRNSAKERKLDAPYAGLRKCLLAVYLVILVLFVVALIVIATLAPIEDTFKMVRTQLGN